MKTPNRDGKWWRHNNYICEIMGLVSVPSPERTRWNRSIARNQPFSANRWQGISTFMLLWLQMNPSKIGLDHKRYEPGQFLKDSYGVIRARWCYIFPPISTSRLIFGKGLFCSCSFWICYPIPWFHKFEFLWRDTSLLSQIMYCGCHIWPTFTKMRISSPISPCYRCFVIETLHEKLLLFMLLSAYESTYLDITFPFIY